MVASADVVKSYGWLGTRRAIGRVSRVLSLGGSIAF